jgi:anti-anti-sigma regulatory factor
MAMRRVVLHEHHESVVIEVDGALDAVGAHDLRKLLVAVLQGAPGDIELDLSRVISADDHGVSALRWCSEQALAAGRTLSWSSCSQALAQDLRTVTTARQATPRAV